MTTHNFHVIDKYIAGFLHNITMFKDIEPYIVRHITQLFNIRYIYKHTIR